MSNCSTLLNYKFEYTWGLGQRGTSGQIPQGMAVLLGRSRGKADIARVGGDWVVVPFTMSSL